MPPLLEHLQRALALDTGIFPSIFPVAPVVSPFKEAIKKPGHLVRLDKRSEAGHQIATDKSTIPARKRMSDLPMHLRSH
jgi:hypothetical protein